MPERVSLVTEDGVVIAGDRYRGRSGGPAALLLHMMPATKESWRAFADLLVRQGFGYVLAIDLRGHGASVVAPGGTRLDHKAFTDAEHQAKLMDVAAAVRWMAAEQGVAPGRLALVGASIGANLAIAFAAADPEVPAVAALSPGLDYRGVTTADKVAAMASAQRLYVAASAEDAVSFACVRELARLKPEAVLRELDGAGHGTAMFERDPGFMAEVASWLAANVS